MTIKDIKKIDKEISRLQAKRARIEGEAFCVSPKLNGTPHGGGASDKVGNSVAQVVDIQRDIQNLEILRSSALNRLSREIMEENCIFMRFSLHYSWTKIAVECGGGNTADSVRMMCERYSW